MLLSRVAESVYWAGRYLERAEATAAVSPRPHRTVLGLAESRRRQLGTAVGGHRERANLSRPPYQGE